MPPPLSLSPACAVGGSVTTASPVEETEVLVPVEVALVTLPSLRVVSRVVVYSNTEVAKRAEVLTIAVVLTEELPSSVAVGELAAPPPPPVRLVPAAVVEASLLLLLLLLLLPPSEVGAAAVVEGAGASDVGSLDGGGLLVVEGSGSGVADVAGGAADDVAGGAAEDAGGAAEDGAGVADGDEPPVPSASCLLPWWRYWLMPSMCRSSRVKADDATVKTKTESQALGNMVGGCCW